MAQHRVVSGMRPTGQLHLGHYHGVLSNLIQLQADPQLQCFFFVADWHALTTHYEHPEHVATHTRELVIDWLASGIDPQQATLFIQSKVPEHAQLHLLLSMLTPLGWLERVPTYKDQQEKLKDKDLSTYGFLGYPVLQAADVLLYKAVSVPVGEDQVSHLELVRELARRFNFLYCKPPSSPILVEPQPLLTRTPKFPGLDGLKMSKSYHNTIGLREDPDCVRQKIRAMQTDPARVRRSDPGTPEICPVYAWHQLYSKPEVIAWSAAGCRRAEIGCLDCKKPLIEKVLEMQAPIRERAEQLAAAPQKVQEILEAGCLKAQTVARQTLAEVNAAMGLE